MKTIILEGTMTLQTSVSHIGDSVGINALLRREKVIQPDGNVEDVVIFSGNAMRGMLRDLGMYALLRRLGYGVNEESGEVVGLPLPAFYALFSGGALSSDAGRGLDVDYARRLTQLVPLIGVFGTAVGNQIIPGCLKVGKAIPICKETAAIIPERYHDMGQIVNSIWDLTQKEAYTRKDDAKNDRYRPLIAAPDRMQLDTTAADRRAKQATAGVVVVEDTGAAQQMRYYVETLAAGTMLYWYVILDDASDMEYYAFMDCLLEFSKKPYIGGKSAVGLGKVKLSFDDWQTIEQRVVGDKAITADGVTSYSVYVVNHAAEIKEVLHGIG